MHESINNSQRKRQSYVMHYCNSTAVRGINQVPPLKNQHNTTLVIYVERWVDSELTMCRKQRILSAPDRTRHQALRGVPHHQAPRSKASSLTSVHPHCSDSLGRRTLKVFRISLAAEKQRSSVIRTSCLYLARGNNILKTSFCQKPL